MCANRTRAAQLCPFVLTRWSSNRLRCSPVAPSQRPTERRGVSQGVSAANLYSYLTPTPLSPAEKMAAQAYSDLVSPTHTSAQSGFLGLSSNSRPQELPRSGPLTTRLTHSLVFARTADQGTDRTLAPLFRCLAVSCRILRSAYASTRFSLQRLPGGGLRAANADVAGRRTALCKRSAADAGGVVRGGRSAGRRLRQSVRTDDQSTNGSTSLLPR